MSFTCGGALGWLAMGLIANTTSIETSWWLSAVIFAAAAPGYLRLRRLSARSHDTGRSTDPRR